MSQQIGITRYSTLLDDIIDLISAGGLIPIIGDEVLFVTDAYGNDINLIQYVYDRIAEKYAVKELISDRKNFNFKNMAHLEALINAKGGKLLTAIKQLLREENLLEKAHLPEELDSFLRTGDFPLLLTTSCTDALEHILCDRYRKSVCYDRENKHSQDIGDVDDDSYERLREHTIYHLFGSFSSGHRNVLTEKDFLIYLHCLHDSGKCPERLLKYVGKRKILSVGCSIPDWTFRFFLYSLKDVFEMERADNGFNGGVVETERDEELADFLGNISYYYDSGVKTFLKDLNLRLNPEKRKSVFVSVVSSDIANNSVSKEQILRLISYLRNNLCMDVWFCSEQLSGESGERYWKKIQEGLSACDYFMPVLTGNVLLSLLTSEIKDTTPYPDAEPGFITEWKYAAEERNKRKKSEIYCAPYMIGVAFEDVKKVINKIDVKPIHELIFGDAGVGQQIVDTLERIKL